MIEKNKATEFIDTQNSLNEFVKKLDGNAVIGFADGTRVDLTESGP